MNLVSVTIILSLLASPVSAQIVKRWPQHGNWTVFFARPVQDGCYIQTDVAKIQSGSSYSAVPVMVSYRQGTDMGSGLTVEMPLGSLPDTTRGKAQVTVTFPNRLAIKADVVDGLRGTVRAASWMMPDPAAVALKYLLARESVFVVNGVSVKTEMSDAASIKADFNSCMEIVRAQ